MGGVPKNGVGTIVYYMGIGDQKEGGRVNDYYKQYNFLKMVESFQILGEVPL